MHQLDNIEYLSVEHLQLVNEKGSKKVKKLEFELLPSVKKEGISKT